MVVVAVAKLLVVAVVGRVADVVHVGRRSEGAGEIAVVGVGGPVRLRLTVVVRLTVEGAVSGGEGVPEVDCGVGIHWVRRVYAGHEGEARW